MRPLSLHHLTMLQAHPLELVEAAAAGGFDYYGLRLVAPMSSDTVFDLVGQPAMVREVHQRMRDLGVKLLDIEAIWLKPETRVEDLVPALETGHTLGAKYVLAVGYDPEPQRLMGNFCRLCQAAAKLNMVVVLEFITYCSIATLDQALDLVRRSGQPNARLLVDALQFFRSGAQISQIASLDPALMPYAQICDGPLASPLTLEERRREARTARLLPGQGELPVRELVSALPPLIALSVEAPTLKLAGLPFNEHALIVGQAARRFLQPAAPGPAD